MSAALSLSQARRIALDAQGLARRRPTGPATARAVGRTAQRLQLIQIDSVNVLTRSQYLPVFSRLGSYDIEDLHRLAHRRPRRLVEYWAHEASLILPELYPLFLERSKRWKGGREEAYFRRILNAHPGLARSVLAELEGHGPQSASQMKVRLEHDEPRNTTNWGWNWSVVKQVMEALFWTGQISSAARNPQFERLYDLTERVLPPAVLQAPAPGQEEAVAELTLRAARAHGIGTVRCFADYFRVPLTETAAAVRELAGLGLLEPVTVRGWDATLYRHPEAVIPRRADGRALLSPFDSLVFERQRTERLFGFHYRIGIYTPAALRTHGYYVLPFLLGETLAARVDLKADRAAGALLVRAAFAEPGAPAGTAVELAAELREMAEWMGLGEVRVEPAGDLAAALGAAVAAS